MQPFHGALNSFAVPTIWNQHPIMWAQWYRLTIDVKGFLTMYQQRPYRQSVMHRHSTRGALTHNVEITERIAGANLRSTATTCLAYTYASMPVLIRLFSCATQHTTNTCNWLSEISCKMTQFHLQTRVTHVYECITLCQTQATAAVSQTTQMYRDSCSAPGKGYQQCAAWQHSLSSSSRERLCGGARR